MYAAIDPAIEGFGGSYLANGRISSHNKIIDDVKECEMFFNFTCKLMKIENFGNLLGT